jgi:low affinity Fe/Cu permease
MSATTTNHGDHASANHRQSEWPERFSRLATAWTGSSWAFAIALLTVVVWALTGPLFGFSDTWQLVINTGTTVVTFLMVFLIQRTQNKDSLAIQLKLNELLAAQQGASNHLINLEDWGEEEITALHRRFASLSERLQRATDECESHSVAEANDALEAAQENLAATAPNRRRARPR